MNPFTTLLNQLKAGITLFIDMNATFVKLFVTPFRLGDIIDSLASVLEQLVGSVFDIVIGLVKIIDQAYNRIVGTCPCNRSQ